MQRNISLYVPAFVMLLTSFVFLGIAYRKILFHTQRADLYNQASHGYDSIVLDVNKAALTFPEFCKTLQGSSRHQTLRITALR